ncbi:hypothetical protein CPB84DRAFT_1754138 [Gymnopilus junonius]|uniref:Uncharacterized protein n=1 Tax=Gymnopilus junonius TaxID=109634 RepID=A0A9P5N7B7_GYMJU|nr:hypothetical protein CPB84DRAFT_1754138 [Gymnopilus junonius]
MSLRGVKETSVSSVSLEFCPHLTEPTVNLLAAISLTLKQTCWRSSSQTVNAARPAQSTKVPIPEVWSLILPAGQRTPDFASTPTLQTPFEADIVHQTRPSQDINNDIGVVIEAVLGLTPTPPKECSSSASNRGFAADRTGHTLPLYPHTTVDRETTSVPIILMSMNTSLFTYLTKTKTSQRLQGHHPQARVPPPALSFSFFVADLPNVFTLTSAIICWESANGFCMVGGTKSRKTFFTLPGLTSASSRTSTLGAMELQVVPAKTQLPSHFWGHYVQVTCPASVLEHIHNFAFLFNTHLSFYYAVLSTADIEVQGLLQL